jgi:hypothetical protein
MLLKKVISKKLFVGILKVNDEKSRNRSRIQSRIRICTKIPGPGTMDKRSSLEVEQQTMFFKGWKIQKILPHKFFFVKQFFPLFYHDNCSIWIHLPKFKFVHYVFELFTLPFLFT